MGSAVAGAFIIGTFLVVAALSFTDILGTSATQDDSLRQASELRASQVTAGISVSSTSAVASGGGTDVTVLVYDEGSSSYADFSQMDVLVQYTTDTGDWEVKHLEYVCMQLCGGSGDPGQDEWTISSISPDTYNPNVWDPDETATLLLRVVPAAQAGTSATVLVVVPEGIYQSAYFTG